MGTQWPQFGSRAEEFASVEALEEACGKHPSCSHTAGRAQRQTANAGPPSDECEVLPVLPPS